MKIAFRLFILFSLFVLTFCNCKSRGKGKLVYKIEAQTDKLSSDDEKLIEKIYTHRLTDFGIDEKDISIKADGKIFSIVIDEVSNYNVDSSRLEKILQSSAHLSFWETYEATDIGIVLNQCFINDSVQTPKLPELIIPGSSSVDGRSCCLFYVLAKDTSAVNAIFARWEDKLPSNFRFMWTSKPNRFNQSVNQSVEGFGFIALKANAFGKAGIAQPFITEARTVNNRMSESPEISMKMDEATGSMWAEMTKANIGKSIAIVVDGYVYCFPTVQSEIQGGVSSITGNFTKEEIDDLVAIISIDPMPYPMRIIERNVLP